MYVLHECIYISDSYMYLNHPPTEVLGRIVHYNRNKKQTKIRTKHKTH